MRIEPSTGLVVLVAALAVAGCASTRDGGASTVEVAGTIEYLDVEGGVWVIRTDDATVGHPGPVYEPSRPLDAAWRKPHLAVTARLRLRDDLVSGYMVGRIADVLALAERPCGPVPCPLPAWPVSFSVAGMNPATHRMDAVTGARLEHPTTPSGPAQDAGCQDVEWTANGAPTSFCWIGGDVPGTYEADVIAPGYAPLHVRFEVAARTPFPYECCPTTYEPVRTAVNPWPEACGGIAGLACSREGMQCVDDPRDDCDPAAGGADCIGVCVPE